jgi:hypothetical protein
MFEMMVILILVVGLVTFSIGVAVRWAVGQVSAQVERRFRHTDCLVNQAQIPAEWLAPYQREIQRIAHPDESPREFQRVVQRARATCLRNIDTLIRFYENSPFVDNPGTRALLLDQLREQRDYWTQTEWDSLLVSR